MGVVHHGVYPLYCEISRTHVCECLGLPYHELEKEGIYLMVVEMTCRYRAPARYGDRIFARGAIHRLTKRLLSFRYEIRNHSSNALLYTGTSTHLVSRGTEGTISLPAGHFAKLQQGVGPAK